MQRGNANVANSYLSSIAFLGISIIAFGLPFTMLIQIKLVGTLFLYDLASPTLLVILIFSRSNREMLLKLNAVWLLLGLWLFGAVATDVVRHTPMNDLSRGWSRLILLAVNIAVIWMMFGRDPRLIAIYGIATGLVLALQPIVNPGEFSADDPWKFGGGMGLMLAVASLSAFPFVLANKARYLPVAGVALLSFVSLVLNARTIFAVGALTVMFTFVSDWMARKRQGKPLHPVALIGIVILGLAVAFSIFEIYGVAASSGWLGDSARLKYVTQSATDANLLLAGRSESLASVQAIKDSPLLGHGSWAVDPYYTMLWFTKMRELGIDPTANDYRTLPGQAGFIIPSHSYLLGSWVDAGVLSAPFWIWAIILALRAIYVLLVKPRLPVPLVTLCALLVIWDVLFSPFAAEARIIKAFQLVVLILAVVSNGGSVFGVTRRWPLTRNRASMPPRGVTATVRSPALPSLS